MDKTSEQVLEKIISSPAVALEKTIDTSKAWAQAVGNQETIKHVSKYWKILGPGLTTGAADDDPSGIATYSQQGAQYGYQLLWLAPLTFPLMAAVQEMCARIGLVTGRGLAANIRHYFPKKVLYISTILLLIANTLNLGADLGAMAKAAQLLWPSTSFLLLVLAFTVISLGMQIFTSYKNYSRYLKFLALILISYVFSTLSIPSIDWRSVLERTIQPTITFSKDQLILITGILGTTISPYLFFWQPSQEVEEEILKGKVTIKERQEHTSHSEIRDMRIDVWSGMFVSNLVMFFIVLACAATLNLHGLTTITTAADAAAALKPLAGDYASLLFALGIIGSGLLAVPILAGSVAYAISEAFEWKSGLYHRLPEASAFYGVILISVIIGFTLNFLGWDPIKILIYSAVLNGLVAPVILFFIVKISSNSQIMGKWNNHPFITFIGWFSTILMTISSLVTLYLLFC